MHSSFKTSFRSEDNDVKGFITACLEDVRKQIGAVRKLQGQAGATEFVVRGRRKKQLMAKRARRMGEKVEL